MSNSVEQFTVFWFRERLAAYPSLILNQRFFENGDFGDLVELEVENDRLVGAIHFWSQGQLGLMLVNKESGLSLLDQLVLPEQIAERERASKSFIQLLATPKHTQSSKIQVIQGDITRIQVDAIVNAANTSLLGGGGVDGAIHKAGGPKILEECRAIRNRQGGCKVGKAVITNAGDLATQYVIHTVGPVWNQGKNNEEDLLASAYTESLLLASQYNIKIMAFPNISTGIYKFPKEKAASIAVNAVSKYLEGHPEIERVIFVCFDKENFELYKQLV